MSTQIEKETKLTHQTNNNNCCTPGVAKASSDQWSLKIDLFQYSSSIPLAFSPDRPLF